MPTTTITVQEVRPQQANRKTCTLVDVTGTAYLVWPRHANLYQPGGSYDIVYALRNNMRLVDDEPRPSSGVAQQPQPRTSGGGGGYNTYRETSQADKASMFVTALMKAAVQAQMVDIHNTAEIAQIGRNFKEAHAIIWGTNAPAAASRQELNDEIAF